MPTKKLCGQLNIFKQCKEYNLSLWQCPQFLFVLMGLIIISSVLISYAVGIRFIDDPLLVALLVLIIAIILFIITNLITQSFERLAQANRMKSEFISIVSHQLRSPLSNLKWSVEILTSGRVCPVDKKQADYFKILKENSQRMSDLISDLLMVSRIEEKKIALRMEQISLSNVLQSVIEETRIMADKAGVKIDFQLPDQIDKVITDEFQVRQIFKNLLENAVRYTNQEGKVIVRLSRQNGFLHVQIKDDGLGIPEDDQKYIFERFFRSENIKHHQTEGSGLGLYIARSLTEKLGGKIGFSSKQDQGSTFWFTLPIHKKQEMEPKIKTQK